MGGAPIVPEEIRCNSNQENREAGKEELNEQAHLRPSRMRFRASTVRLTTGRASAGWKDSLTLISGSGLRNTSSQKTTAIIYATGGVYFTTVLKFFPKS